MKVKDIWNGLAAPIEGVKQRTKSSSKDMNMTRRIRFRFAGETGAADMVTDMTRRRTNVKMPPARSLASRGVHIQVAQVQKNTVSRRNRPVSMVETLRIRSATADDRVVTSLTLKILGRHLGQFLGDDPPLRAHAFGPALPQQSAPNNIELFDIHIHYIILL